MNKAVFLDRDGVINPLVYNLATCEYESPNAPEEYSVYPWLLKSLRMLKQRGFLLFVISNQPSFAKGKTSLENIKAIEKLLQGYVEENGCIIDGYYYCYHHPEGIVPGYGGPCGCRKPGTLFLLKAQDEFDLCFKECYFIGDQDTDIMCGKAVGMETIKIENKHSAQKSGREEPGSYAANLYEAAKIIASKGE